MAVLTLLKTKLVSDTTARPIRGTLQGSLAFGVVDLIDSFHTLTKHQFGASLFFLTIVVAVIQNYLENSGKIPALLKNLPPLDEPVPVIDTDDPDEEPKPRKRTTKKTTTKKTTKKAAPKKK